MLAVDPGRDTGWAVYREDYLVCCGLGRPPRVNSDEVVIENPKIYGASSSRADPADILKLARRVGRLEERYEQWGNSITLVEPHDWKGSLPKLVWANRIIGRLRPAEAELALHLGLCESKLHNVIDAIGIGLWRLKRLDRVRRG